MIKYVKFCVENQGISKKNWTKSLHKTASRQTEAAPATLAESSCLRRHGLVALVVSFPEGNLSIPSLKTSRNELFAVQFVDTARSRFTGTFYYVSAFNCSHKKWKSHGHGHFSNSVLWQLVQKVNFVTSQNFRCLSFLTFPNHFASYFWFKLHRFCLFQKSLCTIKVQIPIKLEFRLRLNGNTLCSFFFLPDHSFKTSLMLAFFASVTVASEGSSKNIRFLKANTRFHQNRVSAANFQQKRPWVEVKWDLKPFFCDHLFFNHFSRKDWMKTFLDYFTTKGVCEMK